MVKKLMVVKFNVFNRKPRSNKRRIMSKWYKNPRNWSVVCTVDPIMEGWKAVNDMVLDLTARGFTVSSYTFS